MDIATCMYHTGLNPFTGEEVYTSKNLRDRRMAGVEKGRGQI
jgi:hypothetical protein